MKTLPWWTWVIALLVVVAAVAAGVMIGRATAPEAALVGEEGTSTPSPEAPEPAEPVPPVSEEPEAGEQGEAASTRYVRVYLARGEFLGVALRPITETPAVATAAMQQLLLGPTVTEQGYGLASQIPTGTRLLGITVTGGTARVNLSGDFAAGGGSLSMTMRLAQVVYTLTQFSTVERVVLLIDGVAVEALGGEGLMVDRPQTRADFEAVSPAILVENPTPGDDVSSPVRVRGTANTFEAAFMVRIEDPDGRKLAEVPAMATSGSGTRGTFDITVPFTTMKSGLGSVVVFEYSARDGSEIHIVEIPVVMLR